MISLTALLSDNTTVALSEDADSSEEPFQFSLRISGTVVCRYNDFDFAWEDFGRTVRCASLEEARGVANS
jgi:hypothetical protein